VIKELREFATHWTPEIISELSKASDTDWWFDEPAQNALRLVINQLIHTLQCFAGKEQEAISIHEKRAR
jgi:hypothetical protein